MGTEQFPALYPFLGSMEALRASPRFGFVAMNYL
jgi:hypothetical protein